MGCRLLCVTLLALLAGCYGQPCTLITPSVLHRDSDETIVLDGHNAAFDADVEIQDFPKRNLQLSKQKISLNDDNNFLGSATVRIPSKVLAKDPKSKQYVYVTVTSPVCSLEKVVLLGHQSGYAFIQTDKTIYTPGSNVLYHVFSMDDMMSPVNRPMVIEFLSPEDTIVKRDIVESTGESGIISFYYTLPQLLSVGVWTISVRSKDSFQLIYSTGFEVKDYVLPIFEIQLIPEKEYFYVDDPEFLVDIKAKSLYGRHVDGMAFVIFGVEKDDTRTSLPDTLRQISIRDGEGQAVLKREDLVRSFTNPDDLLRHSLYMSVTLVTDAGSDIVESKLENIPIVKSSYNVLFTKTSKYFKPGMPFDLLVYVTNPYGSPAYGVHVVAEPGKVMGITGAEGTARLSLNTAADMDTFTTTVRTSDPALPSARQASTSMTANAYQSDGNYIYIGITASEVKPGDNLLVYLSTRHTNMTVQNQIQHFTYLITTKGRIVKVGRQPRLAGQSLVTMSLPITEDLIPSFRIIAYYIVSNEIVSDSIRVDLTDSCMRTLLVTGNTERDNEIQNPGSSMKLKLQADHMASVSLVAVEKSAHVMNSKFKISQMKVMDSVGMSDTGCTPGGGADSMGVFYDAGLALQSTLQSTPQRSEQECAVRISRRRRSPAQEIDPNITNGADYDTFFSILSRTEFAESWIWRKEKMTERPNNKGISTKLLNVFLKDSVTTWEVQAVSLSKNKGICVSKPYEIRVSRNFFIDLEFPKSAVRNEQVEIRAVIYNYGYEEIRVKVELTHNPEFCSLSTANSKFHQFVAIKPQSSVTVPFILMPLSLGHLGVEVMATGDSVSDGVRKMLKVVPEGVQITKTIKSVTLDPQVAGKDGVQEVTVPAVDEKNLVHGTNVETIVKIQALAPYQRDINLNVSISLPGRLSPVLYQITSGNCMVARRVVTKNNKEFAVKAEGEGQVNLTVTKVYHVIVTEKKQECKNFDLSVTVKEESNEGAFPTTSVEICASHNVSMPVLEVSMMTGFAPDVISLNKLKRGMEKFGMSNKANDKGPIIFYLDKMKHREDECFTLNVNRIYKVGLIQPGSVTVYDHYKPENRCTKFYHMEKDRKSLHTICQNSVCRCAEDSCFQQQHPGDIIYAAWRYHKACSPGVDYVYKVHLEEIQKKSNYDNYVMNIINVIKEGTEEKILNKKKNFFSHIKCHNALNLTAGSDYLIWGPSGDLLEQPDGYSYVIGKDTWIERWPNDTECQDPENSALCGDLRGFSAELNLIGCLH